MTDLNRLCDATLSRLPAEVLRPAYDRTKVRAGIVHLGVGAFFRAHGAVFADDALGRGETAWGVVAASLRSRETRDALGPQDFLYAFALRDGRETQVRVIGSILDVIVAPEEPERLVRALADPAVRVVTLTVTEKGYAVDIASGRLDRSDAGIRRDLEGLGPPVSALGFLAAGLARRREEKAPPLALLSCDNLPRNGDTLRAALLEFAGLKDPKLAGWIACEIGFPSSMVDRIVPATTARDRVAVDAALGLADAWPVVAEPAFDWVIEDRFPGGRPPFEGSGVRFVEDVEPFEHMKLRLLNGAHTAIAAIGRLAGYETVPEAVADGRVQRFLEVFWDEAAATLTIDPAIAADYRAKLLPRFGNPALPHRCAQIATDASSKVPQRFLAPLRDRLREGLPAAAITFAVAAWIRSCEGIADDGTLFPLADPLYERWPGKPAPGADALATADSFLGFAAVFGTDLPGNTGFRAALCDALEEITAKGVLAALAERFR